ncbi:MAG: GIY-YIG nuclease family protein, partial [Methanomicrobiales archaeon]|nr:GIY-YIG nuclease family protein [Methanomicrobiales archaeon]
IYCLLLENGPAEVAVGSLGTLRFRRGWHLYVGSALGPGGLARVERHHRLHRNRDRSPRWHIDYLLLSLSFRLRSVLLATTGEDLECRLAETLGPPLVPGFGCSDCTCPSHLFFRRGEPRNEVAEAIRSLGLAPVITTL